MSWRKGSERRLAVANFLFFQFLAIGSFSVAQTAQTTPPSTKPQKVPTVQQQIEVTATRLPEDPEAVPAPIEVFTGEELSARGARDLRGALSSAVGVEIAPGGDTGPASSVPDFWGLKEFDAFLLVVDGVPWGGAFNPALTSLELNDIDRIEVLRGPASVTYGATSFVGVIQVVHKDAAAQGRSLTLHGGSYGSGGGALSTPIPLFGDWSSRLTISGEHVGFRDDRTDYRRGHALWRLGEKPVEDNRTWLNFDVNWVDQNPASPRVREGTSLSPRNPVDTNYNPQGAFLDDHRFTGTGGIDRKVAGALWSTTASVSHSNLDEFRGFIETLEEPDPVLLPDNAHGFKERIHLTDIYVDSHLSWRVPRSVTLLLGADYIHGIGNAEGADFDYPVHLNGTFDSPVPKPDTLDVTIKDHRDLFGPYASVEWRPLERMRFDAGIRLNVTHENRKDADPGAGTASEVSDTPIRASGNLGAIFTAWQHDLDVLNLYVDYRDTFKPAAIDFGIGEGTGGLLLKPETSRSVEGGVKGRFWQRRVEWEASGFFMDFSNLVVFAPGPTLVNAGDEHFKGFESEVSLLLPHDFIARANYSYHDARFIDFLFDFGDGTLTQLAGNRLEMSAHNLSAVSLFYAPLRGVLGGVSMNYTGSRFLNKRNSALAEGFATVDLSAGFRTPRWEIRVDARNLADRRDPVAESEFGDAQYYLMTSRRVEGGVTVHF
jgi:iron complex outermembrane recepter protein